MADPILGGYGLGGEFQGSPSALAKANTFKSFINEPAAPDEPIQLTGIDLRRFTYRFFEAFNRAEAEMIKIHEDALYDQAVYEMVNRISPIDGSEQYTTPMTRNTTNGVVAHIKDAIEQPQLFSFKARSFGRVAAEATQVANLAAGFLEREVEIGGSRPIITSDIVRAAVTTGTAITPIKKSTQKLKGDEEFFYFGEPIPLTRFYVDRVSTRYLWETSCFYYDKQRMYTLEEMALDGVYDQDTVADLMNHHITSARTFTEDIYEFNEDHRFQAENTLVTLLYGYMMFRPEGEKRARLFEGIADKVSRRFLSLRENPFSTAFNAPPLALWRIGLMPNSLFGTGIGKRLRNTQKMMDREVNNYFQFSDKLAQPPFLFKEKSWIGQMIKQQGQAGIRAGMGIPVKNPESKDVQFIDWHGNPGVSFGSVNLIDKFKEEASYTNESLSSTDSRKTLGQTQIEAQRGTLNLRVDLSDFAQDGATAGEMLWRAIAAYKIRKYGVVELYRGGKLLSYDRISAKELNEMVRQPIYESLLTGAMTPQEAAQFEIEFRDRLTDGKIPHINRLDLAISFTGTKIIADKLTELAMLRELTQYITALLPAAAQNSYINYHLKSMMLAMGIRDTELRMPPDPNQVAIDAQDYEALTAQFNEIVKSSSTRF